MESEFKSATFQRLRRKSRAENGPLHDEARLRTHSDKTASIPTEVQDTECEVHTQHMYQGRNGEGRRSFNTTTTEGHEGTAARKGRKREQKSTSTSHVPNVHIRSVTTPNFEFDRKTPATYVSLRCRDDDDMVLNFIIHYAIKEFPIRALPTPFLSAPNFQHIFVSIIYPNKL